MRELSIKHAVVAAIALALTTAVGQGGMAPARAAVTGTDGTTGTVVSARSTSSIHFYTRQAIGTGVFPGATPVCDPGDYVTGGGATHSGGTIPTALLASRPNGTVPNGWHVRFSGSTSTQITGYAVCTQVTQR